jgi:hypothetical protein
LEIAFYFVLLSWLLLTGDRPGGDFRSRNTLKSTQHPNFDSAYHPPSEKLEKSRSPSRDTSGKESSYELPILNSLPSNTYSPSTPGQYALSPQYIGDSSSLFDSSPAAAFDSKKKPTRNLPGSYTAKGQSRPNTKMVNERSPAKAPFRPATVNEQSTSQPDGTYLPKPMQAPSAPRFGETTLPHSPLNRAALESRVFIMPKPKPAARPENKGGPPTTSRFFNIRERSNIYLF